MELQVQTVKLVLVLHFETLFGHVWAILDKFSELQVFAHRFPSLRMLRFDRCCECYLQLSIRIAKASRRQGKGYFDPERD